MKTESCSARGWPCAHPAPRRLPCEALPARLGSVRPGALRRGSAARPGTLGASAQRRGLRAARGEVRAQRRLRAASARAAHGTALGERSNPALPRCCPRFPANALFLALGRWTSQRRAGRDTRKCL